MDTRQKSAIIPWQKVSREKGSTMKSLLAEFKEFINRGNVIDMAVGIIIGAAFTAIVTSLTDDIINPLIKLITGGNGTDVAGLTIPVAGTENGIDFGAFISAIINFLIVAWVVFMIVKAFNKMKDGTAKLPFMKNAKGEEVIEHAPTCPFCLEEINVGATRCPHCTAELPAPAEVTIEVVKKLDAARFVRSPRGWFLLGKRRVA